MCSSKTLANDRIGQVINDFEILSIGERKKHHQHFNVKCLRCGRILSMPIDKMKKAKRSTIICMHTKVSWPDKRIGMIYHNMRMRCYNRNNPEFYRYGGRGITIENEWLYNPESFAIWSINNGYLPGLTIDRVDNNGPYSPDNCRWIPESENKKWTSRSYRIQINGEYDTIEGWAKRIGYTNGSSLMYYKRKYGIEYVYKKIKEKLRECEL